MITHPANRLVGRRPGYALDYDAVYAAAVETGTALEVDGAPSHLDLDGEHARAAIAAGVTLDDRQRLPPRPLAAAADARSASAPPGAAGSKPEHVLNTRPIAEVRAFIAAKRRRSR